MKRALLFVYFDTHFVEQSRVAAVLRAQGVYEPVFMFAYGYPMLGRDLEECRKAGYRCVDGAGKPIGEDGQERVSVHVLRRCQATNQLPQPVLVRMRRLVPAPLRAMARSLLLSLGERSCRRALVSLFFPRVAAFLLHFRAQIAHADGVMEAVSPAILILPEDNVHLVTGLLVRAARKRGIPSLVVPFTIANAEEIAEAYWHNPGHSCARLRNRVVGILYPRWVFAHRGRELLPLPAEQIVAMELMGIAPPLPWVINSGHSDAIAVESPFMRRYYVASGLDPGKLVMTGAIYDDVLCREMEAARRQPSRLCEELGLDPGKPLLLCALPPDQYRTARPGAEYLEYEAMVRGWAEVLAGMRQFNILVRLHPRTLPLEVPYLEGEYGFRVTDRDTAALIAHCDLYVASVSATIRIAIAACKPVVNYDCYRFRYRDFEGIPGVTTVETRDAFEREIVRLSDPATRREIAAAQAASASGGPLLDGRAHKRILELVDSLVGRGSSPTERP